MLEPGPVRVEEEGETEVDGSGFALGGVGSEERDARGEFAGFEAGVGVEFPVEVDKIGGETRGFELGRRRTSPLI